MTYSNLLAFVYHPLVAGVFGGLMNIAYTVIIFALYLSALAVAGCPPLQRGHKCAGITALIQYAFSNAGF